MSETYTTAKTGYITQIIGPVVDAVFPSGELPKIYSAINIEFDGKTIVFINFSIKINSLLNIFFTKVLLIAHILVSILFFKIFSFIISSFII